MFEILLPQNWLRRSEQKPSENILDRIDAAIQGKDYDKVAFLADELVGLSCERSYLAEPLMLVGKEMAKDPRATLRSPDEDFNMENFAYYLKVLGVFSMAAQNASPAFERQAVAAMGEFLGESAKRTTMFLRPREPEALSDGSDDPSVPSALDAQKFVAKYTPK